MKRLNILLFTLLCVATITSACTQNGFTIEGNITGDSEGVQVYLFKGTSIAYSLDPRMLIDSTEIRDNKFRFTGELSPAELLVLQFKSENAHHSLRPIVPIFIDKGIVTIESAFEEIPIHKFDGEGIYDFSKIKVSGPKIFEFFKEYMSAKLAGVQAGDNMGYVKYLTARPKPPVSEGIAATTKIDQAREQRFADAIDFIKKHTDNMLSFFIFEDCFNQYAGMNTLTVAQIEEVQSLLSQKYKNTEYGRKVMEMAERAKRSEVGAAFIDANLRDIEDNPILLSDYAGKGKYLLLEFWASWCFACRADIPHLKEVYELYHPSGFEIISISMDDDKAAWLKAVEAEQMPWLQISDLKGFRGSGTLAGLYNFPAIPACVLISPDGTILTRNMRGPRMDKILIDLYGNLFGDKY